MRNLGEALDKVRKAEYARLTVSGALAPLFPCVCSDACFA
jgi:hypothetical protein